MTRQRSRAGAVAGILVLLVGAGCAEQHQADEAPRRVSHRLIEDYPSATLDKMALSDSDVTQRWEFPDGLQDWEIVGAEIEETSKAGLILRPTKSSVVLTTIFEPPQTIDLVEGSFTGGFRGFVNLFWTEPGGRFSREKKTRFATGSMENGQFSAPVGGGVGRATPIQKLRIKLVPNFNEDAEKNPVIGIRELATKRWTPAPGRIRKAATSPVLADLQSDVRPAWLGTSKEPISWPITIPKEARLELATAVLLAPEFRARFVIKIRRDGSEPLELFSRLVGQGDVDRWIGTDLDLSRYEGMQAVLEFHLEAAGGRSANSVVALWGNPIVTTTHIPESHPRPDVLLVSVDTLRSDHLSHYGHHRPTSPNLTRWADSHAVTFENAVATAPWTLPSHTSMLTGLSPLRHNVNHSRPVPRSLETLAERLRAVGYRTVAVTGGGYLNPKFGFNQGFDRYLYWPEAEKQGELESGIRNALSLVESYDNEPLFIFFHTYEVHGPYDPREPYFSELAGPLGPPSEAQVVSRRVSVEPQDGFQVKKRFMLKESGSDPTESDLELVKLCYDSSIAYTDQHLSRLLDGFYTRGRPEGRAVVITSDHGEALGEKGLAAHAYLYDFNLMVPLIIALPDSPFAGHRVSDQVSLVSIVPTILDALGLEKNGLDGDSLIPLLEGRGGSGRREAISYASTGNRGISLRVDNRLKLLFNNTAWPGARARHELYGIQEDPGELEDLSEHEAAEKDYETLETRVHELLAQRTGLLEVRFENPTQETITAELSGRMIMQNQIKTYNLACDCAEWKGRRTAAFSVPGSAAYSVQLEGFDSRPLKLSTGPCPEASVVVKPGQIEAPGEFSLAATCPPGNPDQRLLVELRWLGGNPHAGQRDGESPSSPELMDQLRALGYVE